MSGKRIEVIVAGDVAPLERAYKRGAVATEKFSAKVEGLGHSFRETAKTYGALVGIVGAGALIERGIEQWERLDKAQRALDAQLRANRESLEGVRPWVDKLNASMERLGFTNADTEEAFTKLDRAGGNAAVAYKYVGLAADLAKAKHLDLATAAQIVGKVMAGNVGLLTRQGIAIAKGTSATDALAIAQRKLAGQAEAGVTPMEHLRATITDLEAHVGGVAVEAFAKYIEALSEWLGKTENQERLLHDVETAVAAVVTVIDATTEAIQTLLPVAEEVTDDLGGIRTVVVGLVGLKIALMFKSWGTAAEVSAGKVGLLSKAFGTLGPAVAVATAAYVAFRVAKDTFEGTPAGPVGNEMPRGGVAHPTPGASGAAGSALGLSVASYAHAYGPDSNIAYVTGGTKPETGFDCSGFVYAAYKANGVTIPRTSEGQWFDDSPHCVHVPKGQEKQGDGVYFEAKGNGYQPPGHCGIYVANGYYIEYYSSGKPAKFSKLASRGDYWGARRWVKIVQPGSDGGGATGPAGSTALPGTAAKTITSTVAQAQKIIKATLAAAKKRSRVTGGKKGAERATYSYTQLRQLWINAGGPPAVADIAAAVAVAESTGRSWVTNKYPGGIAYGCWQISSVHGYDPAQLVDADQSYNAACAVAIYIGAGNTFTDWESYTNRAFEKYLHGHNSPKSSGAVSSSAFQSPTGAIDAAATSATKRAARRDAALKAIAAGNAAAADRFRASGADPNSVYGPYARAHAIPIISGDALLPAALRQRLTALLNRAKGLAALAAVMTGKAADDLQDQILGNLRDQAGVYDSETAALKDRLKGAKGKQRAAIQAELAKVHDSLTGVNDEILGALQSSVLADEGNVQTSFANVRARLVAQFDAATQRMLGELGARFFQGGALTPAERALKAYQDARSRQALQQALTDAKTPEEKKAAQDAIDLDRLEQAATAERAAADKAYAEATAKLQAERSAKEQEMNDRLDALIASVLGGTGSMDDLATIAAMYGLSISADAIPEMGNLASASSALAMAFLALRDFIYGLTGGAPGAQTGGSGNPAGPGGQSWWSTPGWWAPGLARGGVVMRRPGGTLVRIGEGRHNEAVVPLDGRTLGVTHVHNWAGATFIGAPTRQAAKAWAPVIQPELDRIVRPGR